MNWNMFNDPNNLWGRWLKLSRLKQSLALILLMLILTFPALNSYLKQYQLFQQSQQQYQQQKTKLAHQQRLLQSLKQQTEKLNLTPELASQLLPINQQIQQLGESLQFSLNQWFFNTKPQLSLQLQGNYADLEQFLTALLAQYSELKLISLQIQKAKDENQSIESEILLQLTSIKEER